MSKHGFPSPQKQKQLSLNLTSEKKINIYLP